MDNPEWLTLILNGRVIGRVWNRGTPEAIQYRIDSLIADQFVKAARGEASPVHDVYRQMSQRLDAESEIRMEDFDA